MADNIILDAGSGGATIKTDDDGTAHWQYVKVSFGADNTQTIVDSSTGLPVALLAGTAEFGKLAAGTAEIGSVKWAGTAPPIGAGTEAAALRVTVATDSTGTLTVDNAGTFATQATLQAGTAEIGKLAAGTAEIGNVKNAGTFVVQEDGAALTALQTIDNIVHVDDAAYTLGTDSGVMMMGFAGTQSVNANDAGAISMETDGSIHIHDGGNSITVDGTVTANPASGTIDTVTTVTAVTDITNTIDSTISGDALTSLQLIDDIVVTDDAAYTLGTGKGAMMMGYAGAQSVNSGDSAALACTTSGILHVSNATLEGAVSGSEMQVDVVAPLPAGTNAIGKLSANSGVDIGDVDILSLPASTNTIEVVGDVAHDAAAAGNPVLIGSRATADVEALTEVAEADASYVATDLQGVVITRPYIAAQEHVQYHVVNTAGTELAVTGLDAGGAGIHNYITSVIVHNAHASTNGFIQLLDGTGGTPMATFPAPATGGVAITFSQPIKQPTANTALYWDASAAITTLYVTIVGYQGQG